MNHLKSLITAIVVFDMAYISFAGAEDMIYIGKRLQGFATEKERISPQSLAI